MFRFLSLTRKDTTEIKSLPTVPNKVKIEPKSKTKNVMNAKIFHKIWSKGFNKHLKQPQLLKNSNESNNNKVIIAAIPISKTIKTEKIILKASFPYSSIISE